MKKYALSQNFPRLMLILVIFGALLWYGIWRSWSDERRAEYENGVAELGIKTDGHAKLQGFPGYFEFKSQNAQKSGQNYGLSWGEFTTILPLKVERRMFMRIENGVEFTWRGEDGQIIADPLRVEAGFNESGASSRVVVEGRELTIKWRENTDKFSRLVIAFDNTQDPEWAMRVFFDGKNNDVLTANSFVELFTVFERNYLQ